MRHVPERRILLDRDETNASSWPQPSFTIRASEPLEPTKRHGPRGRVETSSWPATAHGKGISVLFSQPLACRTSRAVCDHVWSSAAASFCPGQYPGTQANPHTRLRGPLKGDPAQFLDRLHQAHRAEPTATCFASNCRRTNTGPTVANAAELGEQIRYLRPQRSSLETCSCRRSKQGETK